ncbi:GDSL-type esterase/lipase family protein [Weissella koreensis]|uniref:GDSL-type esterase/lipase family protein n=2 Tax=Weissella koreensis TaxID=165096 RepID=UPI0002174249|nr:GDSL-type esterase/lipase family protein [Weissella koreensis]AEJ23045.1 lysophospholipase L1 related esterase [Weissella koreensis KACC 15510]MCZ9310490.1 GDSL-type esterase/lipase family protein [Weissella koreensis]
MKRILIVLMTLLISFSLSPYIEAKEIVKNQVQLVTVGDSLTQGVGDTTNQGGYEKRIAKLIEKKDHVKVKTNNYGKSGDRSDQILKRVQKNGIAQKNIKEADIIVMTSGGNDLQQELFKLIQTKEEKDILLKVKSHKDEYSDSLNELMNYIRSLNPDAPIFIFGNYNPLYVYLANRPDINQAVHLYNSINSETARENNNAYYVSVFNKLTYGQFQSKKQQAKLEKQSAASFTGTVDNKVVKSTLNGPNKEKNEYITSSDHYHPNNKGYDQMSKALFKTVQKQKDEWIYK